MVDEGLPRDLGCVFIILPKFCSYASPRLLVVDTGNRKSTRRFDFLKIKDALRADNAYQTLVARSAMEGRATAVAMRWRWRRI